MSTVFRLFQAFILKNERERSHCVSGSVGALRVNFALQSKAAIVPPSVIEKPTHSVDILSNIYFKNNLRNDYKKHLTCFCGHLWKRFGICLRCHDRSFLWISEHNATNKRRYFGYKYLAKLLNTLSNGYLPRGCKAVIKTNYGYFEESKIYFDFLKGSDSFKKMFA